MPPPQLSEARIGKLELSPFTLLPSPDISRNPDFSTAYQGFQDNLLRLVKRADGYYAQFCVSVDRSEFVEPTGKALGLDVGLKEFYTDSDGASVENPRFLRQGEKTLKRSQRRVSRKEKGSKNRRKARQILGKRHLKISRQRKDHAVKLARCVVTSSDAVA